MAMQHLDCVTTTPTIRNTFIDFEKQQVSGANRRNKSLPPSFRHGPALSDELTEMPPASVNTVDSDDSTEDARTEASSDDTPSSETGNLSETAPSSGNGHTASCEPCAGVTNFGDFGAAPQMVNAWPQTMGLEQSPVDYWVQLPQVLPAQEMPAQEKPRLSSTAAAFQPSQPLSQTGVDSQAQVAEMAEAAKKILLRSSKIETAELTQGLLGWSLVVAPAKNSGVAGDHVLALAKRALFEAAEKSKRVYVLGYNSPDVAFATKAQGFEAQLAVMGSAHQACWRTFKQGSCHYGATCCKEHPVLQVPVRVFLEAAQFQHTATEQVIQYCNQEIMNFVMMTMALITSTCGVAVGLLDNGDGWTIEMSIPAEYSNLREQFLSLAQSAFMDASHRSANIFVMGYGGIPFIPKPNGFVAMLGEMMDQDRACWNVYKDGLCSREGACRWQHPQCLKPVSIVLKSMEPTMVDGVTFAVTSQE